MLLQHGSRKEMSPPGLNKSQALGKPLFCVLIDFTAAIYKIQNPRKNAWVLKCTYGTGLKFAGII
jgi:hypothetical protein